MVAGPTVLRGSCWVYRLKLGGGPELPGLDSVCPQIREVHSPRHADALLVAGKPQGSEEERRLISMYRAMPAPKVVLLVEAEGAREVLERVDSGAVVMELASSDESAEELVGAIVTMISGLRGGPGSPETTPKKEPGKSDSGKVVS